MGFSRDIDERFKLYFPSLTADERQTLKEKARSIFITFFKYLILKRRFFTVYYDNDLSIEDLWVRELTTPYIQVINHGGIYEWLEGFIINERHEKRLINPYIFLKEFDKNFYTEEEVVLDDEGDRPLLNAHILIKFILPLFRSENFCRNIVRDIINSGQENVLFSI